VRAHHVRVHFAGTAILGWTGTAVYAVHAEMHANNKHRWYCADNCCQTVSLATPAVVATCVVHNGSPSVQRFTASQ
jgi:hypothetical protein